MIENARLPHVRKMVIASDYIQISDSILFKNFTKSTGIHVEIVNLPGRDIYNLIKKDPDNCGIDLLMLRSENQLHKFCMSKFVQNLNEADSSDLGLPKYTSFKYDYIGYAVDPFVIASDKRSRIIRTYNDLTHHPFINDLNKNEAICLLAPVSRKIPKGKAQSWVQSFYNQALTPALVGDSLMATLPVLSMRSSIMSPAKAKIARHRSMVILRSGNAGSFYSLKTFAFVNQCENYSEARTFVKYFMREDKNQYLAKRFDFISVHKAEEVFRPYKISTEELFQYYTLIERWLEKLND